MAKRSVKPKARRPEPKATRPEPKATRREPKAKQPVAKILIMFGLDKDRKPHAAIFTGENEALLARAAASMGMCLAVPSTKRHFEIANKLPAGTIHATGTGLVPNIEQEVFDQISSLVGGEPGPMTPTLPKSLAQLGPGHLVIAQDTVEDGWWPAIIIKKSSEAVTLRWRDFPGEAEFIRPISALAFFNAD